MAQISFRTWMKSWHKPTKHEVLHFLKNLLLVLAGTFILAVGTELFIVPSQLDTGGVSGIAVCFAYAGITVSTELIITIVTWTLFFLGLIFLGWQFSLQTLASTIFYPVALYFLNFMSAEFPWILITNAPSLESVSGLIPLLSALFGGFFVGAGCAITFIGGGSTGGVDIITFIVCKYIKFIKSSVNIFIVDAVIVVAGFLFTKDIALCLEGVFSAFISALVVDKLFLGSSKTFIAYIITDKYTEITKDVIEKLDRTTTIVDAKGGYSGKDLKMVMVSFSMHNYAQLRAIVAKNDRGAFMTINRAHEITGEGFTPLEK